MKKTLATIVAIGALGVLTAASAQQPTFTRTVLQQLDISVPGREAVMALVTLPPTATSGRHTHFGEEIGYILEGTVVIEQEGKPAMTVAAGKPFLIPAGTVHSATNNGTATARLVANYIVEKGKPLATPAPGAAKK